MSGASRIIGVGLAGVIFAIGWWLLIDAAIYGSENPYIATNSTTMLPYNISRTIDWYEYTPAVSSTVFMVLLNLVSLDDMNPAKQVFMATSDVATKIKIWIFVFTTLLCSSVAAAIAVMASQVQFSHSWVGYPIILQPIFTLISAYVMLFSRRAPEGEEFMPMT